MSGESDAQQDNSTTVPIVVPKDSPKPRKTIIIGYVLGGLGLLGLFICAIYATGTNHITLNMMLCILGGSLGCGAGIALSPLDPTEKKVFGEYGKALWAFLSGYVLATARGIIDQTVKDGQFGFDLFSRIVLFLSAFVLVALFWFVARKYL